MSDEEIIAEQMAAALNIIFAQGKRIASTQVTEDHAWRYITLRFDDGTGLLFSGMHLKVKELEIEEVPGFEELPADYRPIPPPSSPPPLLPRGDE